MAMTQAELNREVANATGESVREIQRRGFTLLTRTPVESEPSVLDWDEVQAERRVPFFAQRGRTKVA
jgi:hypothetical protein